MKYSTGKQIISKLVCFASLVILLTGCTKKGVQERIVEKPVSTTVLFRVAQAQDYSSSIFDNIQAELTLTLSLSNKVDGSGQQILWDTTIHLRDIRSYPEAGSPLLIRKSIEGIQDSKESVTVSRVIRYVRSGNEQYMQANGEVIPMSKEEYLYSVDL